MTIGQAIAHEINRNTSLTIAQKKTHKDVALLLIQDYTDLVGAEFLTGVITKTLASTGGDFASLDDISDYIAANKFYQADLTIYVADEVITCAQDETFEFYLTPGQAKLTFVGLGSSSALVASTSESSMDFLYFEGAQVSIQGLTLVRDVGSEDEFTFIRVDGGSITLGSITAEDQHTFLYAYNGAEVNMGVVDITTTTTHTGTVIDFNNNVRATLGDIKIHGPTEPTNTTGLSAVDKCAVMIVSPVASAIDHCTYGLSVSVDGHIVDVDGINFSANINDYNTTVNEIGYDGSYISNNSAALSFKA